MDSGNRERAKTAVQTDEESRVRQAVHLARQGDHEAAREAFEGICTDNNDCEVGWLWLASLVGDAETGLDCLSEVLRINPLNRTALAWLAKAQAPEARREPRVVPKCPLCRTSWPEELRICHSCHALFDLSNPNAFAANDKVNRKVMEGAIERLKASRGKPFEREYYQAVANLNLLHSSEAMRCLTRAAKIGPADARLAGGQIPLRYLKRKRVLVVDDSITAREVMTRTLEKAGFMAVQAASGHEALAAIQEDKPVVVLLDVSMEGMDGHQVCKAIRANAATKGLPVVLVSSKDGMFDRAKGRMAGATDHLAKPFQPQELVRMVQKHTGKKP